MANKMKAAVVRSFGSPLVIEELPVPRPGRRSSPGKGGGVRRVPHRSSCRRRGLARQTNTAIHSRP